MKRRAAVTLIEIIVVCVLAIPLVAVAWNALFGARTAEDVMATAAAIKSASILESYLRRDLASLDISLGPAAVTTTENRCELIVALPLSTPGQPLLARATRSYELHDEGGGSAFTVLRDGRQLASVLVERLEMTKVSHDGDTWLRVDLTTLDPALRKTRTGRIASHGTTILAPIPRPFNPDFLVDYTVWPPR